MNAPLIRLGIPKGSLERATIELFRKAGWKISLSERSYVPSIDDPEISCALVRAQEMARYVQSGVLDAGLTGLDWVLENDADVEMVSDLVYSKASAAKARWVLAAMADSPINRVEDCAGKTIATELVGYTRRFFAERNIPVKVEFSWGATEAKAVEGLVDAVVDVTETGSTLKANGLKIVATLLETNTRLIANRDSMRDPARRTKIQRMAMLLNGALAADGMVGLKMNVPEARMDEVIKMLPSLTSPTVARLWNTAWFSVEIVTRESAVRELVPRLIECGADGIIEYPLNKIVNAADTAGKETSR
jgi:ATP phosphoribosyltransferase